MTSQITQAVRDLKAKCLAIPGITYCAVNNNQVKNELAGLTFNFTKPAIFIELQSPATGISTLGGLITVNEITWKLIIVHEQLSATWDGNAGTGMDEDLDAYSLRDAVKTALTGFTPANCSRLQYHSEAPDYNHNNIYVYTLLFKCSYVDTKGSPLDADSTLWVTGELTDYNLNAFDAWQPSKNYVANASAAACDGLLYLCTTTNNDDTFTPANWLLVHAWQPSGTYTTGSYIAWQNHIYQCAVANTDATFITSNWNKIV